LPEHLVDIVQQRIVVQLRGEQVDRDPLELQTGRAPRRRFRAGGVGDPAADIGRDRAGGERVDERSGRQMVSAPRTARRAPRRRSGDLRLKNTDLSRTE
jgi:hypothetical protein